MIGYILFAVLVVAANANNDARISGWNHAAWERQQLALKAQKGLIKGEYKRIPTDASVSDWTNEVVAIPRDATQITIINHDINNVKMGVGHKGPRSGDVDYYWWNRNGDVTMHMENAGVKYTYLRNTKVGKAYVLISGPANPVNRRGESNLNVIVGAKRASGSYTAGRITWSYIAH